MEVLLNSWALQLLPDNKTGAQLTLDKPIRQNFLSFNLWEPVLVGAGLLAKAVYQLIHRLADTPPSRTSPFPHKPPPTGFKAYLPDLILVQLRVISRWVAAGKSAME